MASLAGRHRAEREGEGEKKKSDDLLQPWNGRTHFPSSIAANQRPRSGLQNVAPPCARVDCAKLNAKCSREVENFAEVSSVPPS